MQTANGSSQCLTIHSSGLAFGHPLTFFVRSLAKHHGYSHSSINHQSSIISILMFLLGLIAGHRLSLQRDKRKEFNEAAIPIRQWALSLKSTKHCPPNKPTLMELDRFTQMLGSRKRSILKIQESIEQIVNTGVTQDPMTGGVTYHGLEKLHPLGDQLLKITAIK